MYLMMGVIDLKTLCCIDLRVDGNVFDEGGDPKTPKLDHRGDLKTPKLDHRADVRPYA